MKKSKLTYFGLNALICMLLMLFSANEMMAQVSGTVFIGEGGTGYTGATSVSPLNPNTRNFRYQVLYTAAEIQAAGGVAGNITRLAWNVHQPNFTPYQNYTIKIGHTTRTSLSAHDTSATTTVFTASSYSATSTGVNDIVFTTPFNWNGTSNILVEVCYSRASTASTGGSVYTTTGTSPTNRYVSNTTTTSVCGTNTNYSNFGPKPQVRFTMNKAAVVSCAEPTNLNNTNVTTTSASFSWTNGSPSVGVAYAITTTNVAPSGSGTNATGTSVNVTTGLSAGTTYYFWLRNRCTTSTNSGWVSIPFSTLCNAPSLTLSATSTCTNATLTANASAGTVYWWDAATGGNLLGTGNSYSTSVPGTYYASAGQSLSGNNIATLGAGASTSTLASQSPFYANTVYKGQSTNYIIKASELLAAGISAGYITSLGFDVVVAGGALSTFYIKAGMTNQDNLSSGFITPSSYFYGGGINGVTYQPVVGVNTFNFSSGGMYWDGTSNIAILIYHQTANSSTATTVKFDNNVATDIARSQWLSSSSSWSTASATHSRPKLFVNGKGLCMSTRQSIVASIEGGDTVFYRDADGDGFGDANTTIMSCVAPAGYVSNSLDCDDTVVMYQDLDGDGFGSTIKVACGGVLNNSDCNDSLITYADLDGDGYAGSTMVACSDFLVANDCDDTNALVNPGAVDVCYDGLDNDCNGVIDNECTPINSVVQPTQCNITLSSTGEYVTALNVSGAQGYRFKVKDLTTNVEVISDRFLRVVRLSELNTFAFDREYEISVTVKYQGVWQPFYGTPCVVKTPAPLTKIQDSQCGVKLNTLNDILYADNVVMAPGYMFKVTNMSNPSDVQMIARNLRDFRAHLISGVSYGTDYMIEVAVRNLDGTLLPFGDACIVTTPDFPTTSLTESYCDAVVQPNATLYFNNVANASAYNVRIVNLQTGYDRTVESSLRSISLSRFPGLERGVEYTVYGSVKINGVWGTAGKACNIYIATQAREAIAVDAFEFNAYPNPFKDVITLEVMNSNTATNVVVYDMVGRLIESLEIKGSNSVQVGHNYPAGVYNVVISDGEQIKSVRIIKQ